ncbi:TPA: transcriptional regulator [Pseudomonas aeruginosa]|uniref:CII family transcriptional regulator n=1 Tax=Pseudomonas aeruginosa TaxID=287 RepID=UPI00071BE795|nr:CII family transcriptional regulator [Pseudomonas aeruginosa]ELM1746982.1 transcriptional regulator [Pseudomonas aeruginosa]KSE10073.1 transcriptional regulator [Pseudomonas aeruginosa]HCF7094097.1 transcriptional regulator [Pseudomonas aeruginosa]
MATTQLDQDQTIRARKNFAILLQRLSSVGNAPVAVAVGCDESTISRMKPEKFLEFARILAVLDLKVVGNEMKCFNEKEIAAILHLAKSKLSEVESVEQLEWD